MLQPINVLRTFEGKRLYAVFGCFGRPRRSSVDAPAPLRPAERNRARTLS